MPDRPTHGWCPGCKEDSAIAASGNCLWCGRATEPSRPKRGGWRRPDLQGSRYTEIQLRALHLAHQRGASINSLAKQTFDKVGYKKHHGAAVAISREWKRMGLKARDRIEATVKASTKHGRGARDRDEGAYRRWFKETHGLYRPTCKGVRAQPPRKGDPCDAPAQEGPEYCFAHDPARRQEVEQILASARLRQARDEMVPMAPFAAWLCRRRAELGTWAAVAERVDRNVSLIHNYGRSLGTNRQPKAEIGRTTVEQLLEADGTATFDDVYDVEAVAA